MTEEERDRLVVKLEVCKEADRTNRQQKNLDSL